MTDTTVLAEAATIHRPGGGDHASAGRLGFDRRWCAGRRGDHTVPAASGLRFGLELVSRQPDDAGTFLTLGAIYFLAAQAFGLAAGGHVTGRLIGPTRETAPEEEFRAAPGLSVWAPAVVITIGLVALSAMVAANAAVRVSTLYGATPAGEGARVFPAATSYWVDTLFRPANTSNGAQHAGLNGVLYAQNDTGTTNDGAAPPPAAAEAPAEDRHRPPAVRRRREATTRVHQPRNPAETKRSRPAARARHQPTTARRPQRCRRSRRRHQASRRTKPKPVSVLDVGLENGGYLSVDDRDRVAQLIAQDAAVSYEDATLRVNKVQAQIHDDERQAGEYARKIAAHASLWIAFALLFGAIVSVVAAISARWEDDMQTMFRFGRPAPFE